MLLNILKVCTAWSGLGENLDNVDAGGTGGDAEGANMDLSG